MTPAMRVLSVLLISIVAHEVNALGSDPFVNPAMVYATSGSPTVPKSREFASSTWSSAYAAGALTGNLTWAVLKSCPTGPERSLVTLADDNSLSRAAWDGTAWSGGTQLAASEGTYTTAPFDAEYETLSGYLMVAYRKSGSATIYFRTYTVASPSEQSTAVGLTAAPTWVRLAARAGSNLMALAAGGGGELCVAIWSGSAWGSATKLETSLPTSGRPFDIAWSSTSGNAIVVWTATTGAPKYATWNGSSWSAASTLPALGGGSAATWLTLAANPSSASNEVLMACQGTDSQINGNCWSGSAWSANTVLEASALASATPRFDACFQSNGAKGLVCWHKSGQTILRYRTWSSGAWSSTANGPDMGLETLGLKIARGAAASDVMMLARTRGPSAYDGYTAYSQNSTVTVPSGSTVSGTTGGQVSGVSLPSPPSATAGSVAISIGNNSTQNISPGSYGALTFGNGGTANFTAGTYVFTSVIGTNTNTLNFDSSAGVINLIVTSGGISLKNNSVINNTGSAAVNIHVNAGDVDFKNSTTVTKMNVYAYAGTITFANGLSGTGDLYASGNIDVGSGSTLSPNPVGMTSTERALAVPWTDGAAGSVSTVSSSVAQSGGWEPMALAGSPSTSKFHISTWREVGPDDAGE